MSKKVNSVTGLVGNTPMINLNRLVGEDSAEVYAKLEFFNPGSSIKDRIALSMIETAEKEGDLNPGGTIVESTSGNTGIGLALIGAAKGYNVVLTMPNTMSLERRKILKAYGVELVLTPGEDGMPGAINKAKELVTKNEDYFLAKQFKNAANPKIHRETTGPEIIDATDGKIDAFVAGVGTGGTITGVSQALAEEEIEAEIIAVEPIESAVLSGEKPGPHKIQGIGAGFIPDVLDTELIDQVFKVKHQDSAATSRKLAAKEGVLAGVSAGASVYAALATAKRLGKGKRVVTVIPDTGERYLSTDLYQLD